MFWSLVTLALAPLSKLFIVLAIALVFFDSISSMEELTGGKELKRISIPVIIVGDSSLKAHRSREQPRLGLGRYQSNLSQWWFFF